VKIVQKEATSKAVLEAVKGTVKVAKTADGVLAVSLYDEKPVHFMTSQFSVVHFVDKTRKVFDPLNKCMINKDFKKLNVINNYNFSMNGVDRADQLRGQYRPDHWLRNRKWWWALFLWMLGIAVTNAYKIYLAVHRREATDPKRIKSHRVFIETLVAELHCYSVHRRESKRRRISSPSGSSSGVRSGVAASHFSSEGAEDRAPKLTDARLAECRKRHDLPHPSDFIETSNFRCQFCYYKARKLHTTGKLPKCPVAKQHCRLCSVQLCGRCWNEFHQL
jgi:hypothetical protein